MKSGMGVWRIDRPDLRAYVWFGVLALIVAGPLLGPGHLLLLDFPAGPMLPRIDLFPPSRPDSFGNGLPLLALHTILREVQELLPDKAFLLAPVLIGGIGVYRLLRRRLEAGALAATYGGTLYGVNPFVYDRYLAGQLYFLLGYSLLPWALPAVADAGRRLSLQVVLRIALWTWILTVASVHFSGIYLLLVAIAVLVGRQPLRRVLLFGGATLALVALLSSYWLLPVLRDASAVAAGADLRIYASRPHGAGVLPALVAMYGFWRDEFPRQVSSFPALYALLVPILGLAVAGWRVSRRDRSRRAFATALATTAALGIVLSALTALPAMRAFVRLAIEGFPGLGVYREPEKFLLLAVLAYAVLGGLGLDALTKSLSRVRPRLGWVACVLALAAVAGYGHGMFWAFSGRVHLSHYPPGWSIANAAMETRGPGRLLVLPWRPYAIWSFSDGRIVANPAPSFFTRDVVSARGAGFDAVHDREGDPVATLIGSALSQRADTRRFGGLVAPAGVRFVAVLREADWQRYGFLAHQRDLRAVYRDSHLVLYENASWRAGPVLADRSRASVSALLGYSLSGFALIAIIGLWIRCRRGMRAGAVDEAPALAVARASR
jgi:hypothetical protein